VLPAISSRFVERNHKPAQCTWSTGKMALALALEHPVFRPFRPGPKCTPRWPCMRLSDPFVYAICYMLYAMLCYAMLHNVCYILYVFSAPRRHYPIRLLLTPFPWPAHYNKFLACISNTLNMHECVCFGVWLCEWVSWRLWAVWPYFSEVCAWGESCGWFIRILCIYILGKT